MAPISADGVAYIHAMSFLKTWGWSRNRGEWVSPVRYNLKYKDIFDAYEKAKEIVEEEHP